MILIGLDFVSGNEVQKRKHDLASNIAKISKILESGNNSDKQLNLKNHK